MKLSTNRKLLTYSALSVGFLSIHAESDAQAFIYTDPTPDIMLDADFPVGYDETFLDVNLDGVNDFRVFASEFDFGSSGGWSMGVQPLAGAQIGQFVSTDYCTTYGTFSMPMLQFVSAGATIDPALDWTNVIRNLVDNTWYSAYGYCPIGFVAGPSNTVQYIPFRLSAGSGSWNYGWIRYNRTGLAELNILDYTVNAIPGAPILAGDGTGSGVPCDAPTALTSMLTGPTTAELSWSPAAMADKYQVVGTRVGTSATYTKVTTATNVTAFSLLPGTYTWEVRTRCLDGTVSAFSPTSSFTVPIPIATPDEGHSSTLRVASNEKSLVANFAVKQSGNAVLSLHDLTGALIEDRQLKVEQGSYQVEMDCSNLPAGVYLISLRSADEITAEKVVIQ